MSILQTNSNITYPYADRIERLTESQTLAMAAKVRELKAAGQQVYSFTLGEPDFDTPDHIRNAAIRAIQEGDTHYPPVAGIPALRAAVCQFYKENFGINAQPNQVVVSTGAKQSLVNVLMSLVNPGEEVIIPAPYWVSYLPMTQMAEARPVIVIGKDENSLKITPEQLEEAITPNTKLFMFNSPSNPTGMVYTESETAELVAVLERHPHVYVVVDEIYALICFGVSYRSMGTFESIAHRTILVNGVSKAFAMTGWRVGVMIAPQPIAALCEKFQSQVTSGTCSIAQRAALEAFSTDLEPTHQMVKAFEERRNRALEIFAQEAPEVQLVKPEGAFYLYPNISAYLGRKTPDGSLIQTADDLTYYLLNTQNVAVISGLGFGTQQHIRLSYACDMQNITEGIGRIAEGFKKLK